MKIDKISEKACIKLVRDTAKEFGYKTISNSIYKIHEDCIICANYLIVDKSRFVYDIRVKKLSFDELFWRIMDMEGNLKERFSLRVDGAFTFPGVFIYEDIIELSEDFLKIPNEFVNVVESKSKAFFEENDIITYILSHNEIFSILKCLAYLDLNDISNAVELARRQVEAGNSGAYINEDKGFFERVLTYYAI